MRKIIIALIAFVIVEANASEVDGYRLYELDGVGRNIIFEVNVVDVDRVVTEITNSRVSDAESALVTYFYLSKQNDLNRIMEMHYKEDGTYDYIKDMLKRSPDAFSGAKNLKSIHIKEKYRIGNHEVLSFIMEDASGKKVRWFEDFVCINNNCKKSNYLNVFGQSASKKLFNSFYGAKKNEVSAFDVSGYKSVVIGKPLFGKDNLMQMHVNVTAIDESAKESHWYQLLNRIQGLNGKEDVEKHSYLKDYLPSIYAGWGDRRTVGFRFESGRPEKTWLLANLSVVVDFKIHSYLDTKKYVWVFASSQNYENKPSNFLFPYSKSDQKFLMVGIRTHEGPFVMNELVESLVFDK